MLKIKEEDGQVTAEFNFLKINFLNFVYDLLNEEDVTLHLNYDNYIEYRGERYYFDYDNQEMTTLTIYYDGDRDDEDFVEFLEIIKKYI